MHSNTFWMKKETLALMKKNNVTDDQNIDQNIIMTWSCSLLPSVRQRRTIKEKRKEQLINSITITVSKIHRSGNTLFNLIACITNQKRRHLLYLV